MVETIAPVVHGERRSRWWTAVALHVLGATVAAAAFGAALGAIGAVLGAPWGTAGLVIVVAVAALYGARELFGVPVPLPDRRRQVPEWWRTFFPPPVSSFLYGLGLGVGFLTYLRHGTLVAVTVTAVAGGEPLAGALLVGPFGMARGLSVIVARGGTSGPAIAGIVDRLERLAQTRAPAVANGLALIALGAAAAGAAASSPAAPAPFGGGVAAWVLAGVFGWAAVSKAVRPGVWVRSLAAYGLGPVERPAAIAVPIAEVAVVSLVLGGAPRVAGVVGLGLVAVFSLAVLRARTRVGSRLPCGCFGRTARREARLILFRNALVAAVAALAAAGPGRVPGFRWPASGEAVPAILVALAVAVSAAMVREIVRMSAPAPRA
jgi:hypothetical protein